MSTEDFCAAFSTTDGGDGVVYVKNSNVVMSWVGANENRLFNLTKTADSADVLRGALECAILNIRESDEAGTNE